MNKPITFPPVLINEYLAEKITQSLPDRFSGNMRFFPTLPTDINALTEGFPEESENVFAIYDRMFKLRRGPFPHIKNEQVVYYFFKMSGDIESLMEVGQIVSDLLDREDESAEEINNWLQPQIVDGVITFGSGALAREFKPVFFHNLKIYQLQETKDVLNFNTARTHSELKIIVEYQYHTKDYS